MLNSILERFPALVQGYINLYMRYRWRAFVICYRGAPLSCLRGGRTAGPLEMKDQKKQRERVYQPNLGLFLELSPLTSGTEACVALLRTITRPLSSRAITCLVSISSSYYFSGQPKRTE